MGPETDVEKIARLERRIAQLEAKNERLRRALEEALRAAKRQAAPFSRRHPKAHPAKPGRKPGSRYGRRCRRPIPQRIDEVIDVPLPARGPHCGRRLRNGHHQRRLSAYGLALGCDQLEARMDRLLARPRRAAQNRRLANHLWRERGALFTFLYCPGLEATNWRAEQAIRPMVVARKVWGGNRTPTGARTQSVLLSVLQTCRQQHRPILPLLMRSLCSSQPPALMLNSTQAR